MQVERARITMTAIEKTVLEDLDTLAKALRRDWIPAQLAKVVINGRKGGSAHGTLRGLARRGYVELRLKSPQAYKRTNKPLPSGALKGVAAMNLPPGAIERVIMHWNAGVHELSDEHLRRDVLLELTESKSELAPEQIVRQMQVALGHLRHSRKGNLLSSWGAIVADHLLLERLAQGPIPSPASKRLFEIHRSNLANPASARNALVTAGVLGREVGKGKNSLWHVLPTAKQIIETNPVAGKLDEERARRLLRTAGVL